MTWPVTTRRTALGEIEVGGVPASALVNEFGTPLYVFDEETLRSRARSIRETFQRAYEQSRIVYAGKAYLSPALMRILVDEGIGLDVVSGGEIYAGLMAGVPPTDMVFHGNNKSRTELQEAIAAGVGLIAVDNDLEIGLLESESRRLDREVNVVLRLNPGVEPHTHAKMRTGTMDSKFGFPVWDGQAEAAAARVCTSGRLRLVGYHAHVGSQIFDPHLVGQTIDEIMAFASRVRERLGATPEVVIPGGGFGMADDASGGDVSIHEWASVAARAVVRGSVRYGFHRPALVVEPGRAIIAPAAITLYEVGARKTIPGIRTYVSVDGGMADNIRPTLYGAKYTSVLANRDPAGEQLLPMTVAGKCCESGDILIEDAMLPSLEAGDLLAVPMTGAYCLSMASNYNLTPRPAVVLVREGHARLIRRRETYQDLLRSDVDAGAVDTPLGDGRLSGGKRSL